MQGNTILQIAAFSGALAVGVGAFGAHGLAETLAANGRTATFETAVLYHFFHTLALLLVGAVALIRPEHSFKGVAIAFLLGILIFSGSLYVLAVFNLPFLGAITPFGGVAFIVGWVLLALKMRGK
ncbi:MAG: DUF423 domain-containing protein [Nitritalea sp.]